MNDNVFDAAARGMSAPETRRGSLALIGGAMLAAVAAPLAAQARNGNGGAGKNANKRCKRQVDGCRTAVLAICAGSPECAAAAGCCLSLSKCNANGFFACIAALSSN